MKDSELKRLQEQSVDLLDLIEDVSEQFCDDNLIWRGYHPFNLIRGVDTVFNQFWIPLFNSLNQIQRRMDIFLAGYNEIEGYEGVWVASMGHLMGLFDRPWLGIPPTQKLIMLRYCEFNKVSNGKISETAMFFDIPHFMVQAGLKPFKSQTAAQLVQPGPITHGGLLYSKQDVEEGLKKMGLEPDDLEELGDMLDEVLGKNVDLTIKVDASIIGGIKLRVENTFLDASIESQIKNIKLDLMKI